MTAPPQARIVPFTLYRFWDAERRPGIGWAVLDRLWPGVFWVDILLYIGISGRVPFKRMMEHITEKSWAHRMRGWDLDPRTWATEEEALAAEELAIRAERPLHNVVHNRGPRGEVNHRGPKWRARRRLRQRLIAAGIGWTALFVACWWLTQVDPRLGPAVAATAVLGWMVFPRSRRPARR